MSIRAEPEMNEIKNRRRSSDILKNCGVLGGCDLQIAGFNWHGVDLLRSQWGMLQ